MEKQISRIFQSIFFAICILILLCSCAQERAIPPAPTSAPSMPSSLKGALVMAPSSPALGRAYAGATRYNLERPDLLISPTNLFSTPNTLTFLPGENSKTIEIIARDNFIWKDAFFLKQYDGSSTYSLKQLELSGTISSDIAAAGLKWIEGESKTIITINRADLNTADPYKNALLVFVHTQPGAGEKVTVNGEQKDVWLVAVIYYQIIEPEANSASCNAVQGKWLGLGGTRNCCGNDAGEFYIKSQFDQSESCCSSATDCVYGNKCLISGAPFWTLAGTPCTTTNGCDQRTIGSTYSCDATGKYKSPGENFCTCTKDCQVKIDPSSASTIPNGNMYCSKSIIKDCDADENTCSQCGYGYKWLISGETTTHGGYTTLTASSCCGNNNAEHVIIGTDGTSACCNQPSPYTIVRSGKCVKLSAAPGGPSGLTTTTTDTTTITPVAQWKFNGNLQDSVGTNNLELTHIFNEQPGMIESAMSVTAPVYAQGEIDQAVTFAPSGRYTYLKATGNDALKLQNGLTFTAWVRDPLGNWLEEAGFGPYTSGWSQIMEVGNNPYYGFMMFMLGSTTREPLMNPSFITTDSRSIHDQKWHYLSGVFEPAGSDAYGNKLKQTYYIDGEKISEETIGIGTITGTSGFAQGPIEFGNSHQDLNMRFMGAIDEAAIYNKPLTASEIQNEMRKNPCHNTVKDRDETGIDCGGTYCKSCS